MIARDIVRDIRQMLTEGRLSQRAIAARTGVSRGTILRHRPRKRGDYPPRYIPKDMHFMPPAGRPVRCSGCGGLVQMPCLACYLRRRNRRPKYPLRVKEEPVANACLQVP